MRASPSPSTSQRTCGRSSRVWARGGRLMGQVFIGPQAGGFAVGGPGGPDCRMLPPRDSCGMGRRCPDLEEEPDGSAVAVLLLLVGGDPAEGRFDHFGWRRRVSTQHAREARGGGGVGVSVVMASSSTNPDKLMAKADKLTKLSFTRWNADWKSATSLYEQAAIAYRFRKDNEKAKDAFEKASKGQEMISSASEFYRECGRPQPASDALAKGASFLEDKAPEEAIKMYDEACSVLEEDGKEQMAFDLYRAAASLYVKLEKYSDAAATFLRLGSAADKCNAINSQCKGYLSAIIIYLYAHDFQQAQKCYNDCSEVQAFLNSDQNRFAMKLLSAYEEGDAEEIKRTAQSSAINHLDHVVIRLARKLPTGDLQAIKKDMAADDGNDSLDENDLT
ncbi:hypothetical protein GUJ93_ZPchr0068g2941 [Zizania palustris]|uniref:Gamma-soluble NSF attachment protein n=1 Tax=Zizania palustris TaxID=103762 RepID=A0A8J5RFP6_ZIZPA|nr:hypothetical protein GUJ93_ZPchr0068g2941 [Zizania palustris]